MQSSRSSQSTQFLQQTTSRPTYARSQRRRYQSSLRRLIVSELRKVCALRSTYWTLGVFFVLSLLGVYLTLLAVGSVSSLATAEQSAEQSGADVSVDITASDAAASSTAVSFSAESLWVSIGSLTLFMCIVLCIFAVLNASGEFSTGLMRQTLLTSPVRYRVYLAKMIVVAITTWLIATLTIFLAWAIASLMSASWNVTPLDHSLWALPYVVLFGLPATIVCLTLFAFAMAMLTKSTAGGICIVIGTFYVVSSVLSLIVLYLPENLRNIAWDGLLPYNAAQQFLSMTTHTTVSGDAIFPNWWQCGIIVLVWAVISNIAGYVRFAKTNIQ